MPLFMLAAMTSLLLVSSWFYFVDPGELLASAPSLTAVLRRGRGRPRKFAAPSRAVTLTLPEDVIETLSRTHRDLSRAIVGLTRRRAPRPREAAELLVFGKRAVITIAPTPSLEPRTGLHLVPLPDGRALIAFDPPMTLADVELLLDDALDDARLTGDERRVYRRVSEILKDARRSTHVALSQQHIIVLESKRSQSAMDKKSIKRKSRVSA